MRNARAWRVSDAAGAGFDAGVCWAVKGPEPLPLNPYLRPGGKVNGYRPINGGAKRTKRKYAAAWNWEFCEGACK